ncbi:MAG: Ribosome-binding factor A [Parcubacteria group bacterium Athens0714_16]|nr:MAG: Ribosome-binding factor A [Parcubacteria group bacterium Athens0714_16]
MTLRQEKVRGLITELSAEFIQYQANTKSMITVTDCNVSSDLKKSTIFVTVFPAENEKEAMDFLKRKRREFREFIKSKMKFMRSVPFFDFEIDKGEKNRQRIDEISNKI